MTEEATAKDAVCKITGWGFLVLCALAVAALAYVATHGGEELSDGWPVFLVFGVAFVVHSVGVIAQGYLRLPGITTVKKSDHPFFFWLLLLPNIIISIGLIFLSVWSLLR